MTERPYQVVDSYRLKDLMYHVLRFELPLEYFDRNFPSRSISVVATLIQKYDSQLSGRLLPENPDLFAYLEGGPGCECRINEAYVQQFVKRGHQMLFMDQRGTGLSTHLDAASFFALVPRLAGQSDAEYLDRQVAFALNFTGASIVEDLERIRAALLGPNKWSLAGQSFGGFCSFIYLSKYPGSLRRVLVTGGVPPAGIPRDEVYTATYARTRERNVHYYRKYPQDVLKVKAVLAYLHKNPVALPNGGVLSVQRFQQLGLGFGASGGTDALHRLVVRLANDLELLGRPAHPTLVQVQSSLNFETNILYALFQETIYSDGNDAHANEAWSAERLRFAPGNEQFVYDPADERPTFFTGEMVFSFMYDDYAELRPFKALAHALTRNQRWPKLYDLAALRRVAWEQVPVVGAMYFKDQYVDFDISRKVVDTAFEGRNFRPFVTSDFFHNGTRADPAKVIGALFSLFEEEID